MDDRVLEATYPPRPTMLPDKYDQSSRVTASTCSTVDAVFHRTSSASSSAFVDEHRASSSSIPEQPPDDCMDSGAMVTKEILASTFSACPNEPHASSSSDAVPPAGDSAVDPKSVGPEGTVTSPMEGVEPGEVTSPMDGVVPVPVPSPMEGVVPECCVCLDAPADINSVLPCGHLCICGPCALALASTPNRNKCPYCRVPFEWRDNCYMRAPDVSPVYDGSLYRQLRANFLEQQARWHCEEPIRCPCGELMVKVEAREAYYVTSGSPVECDVCSRIVRGRSLVYHCPQELDSHHPFGFDLCTNCGIRNHSSGFSCIHLPLTTVKKWFMRVRGLS
eukprot:GEMP01057593.1.p1 GENE.GEMP01057593.1~~GEMP01057593.1.p1  ORF type:complete len:334 (+),score=76.03 GEMP01057593.1:246-1247(+)